MIIFKFEVRLMESRTWSPNSLNFIGCGAVGVAPGPRNAMISCHFFILLKASQL
jgi:hypothetical protein